MNNKNAKTAAGGDRSGFLNTLNQLDGDRMVSAFNNARNLSKNQRFCQCGAIIPRDEAILLRAKRCEKCRTATFSITTSPCVSTDHRKIKLEPCASCLFAFGESKMHGEICAGCSLKSETFSKISSRDLTAAVLGNFLNGSACSAEHINMSDRGQRI